MQRRQTLGNFSLASTTPQAQLHSRLSDANSLLTSNSQLFQQPPNKRTTVAGKDPRKVGDKSFTKQCVDKISRYLESHGYQEDCSRKKIFNPSTNDFLQILSFLQRQYEPDAKPITSPQEQVPILFKKVKYPYQINARLLVTVAAPHTWPHLLAAMAYLVDVLSAVEIGLQEQQTQDDWIAQAYCFSMQGNDSSARQMEDEMSGQFLNQIENLQLECNQIQQATQELNSELQPFKNNPSPLEHANQQKAKKEAELQKYQQSIQSNQNVLQKCQTKLEEQNQDMCRLQAQLVATQQEVQQVKARVDSQPYSKIEVKQMVADLHKSRDILRSVQQQRENLDNQIRDQEIQVEAIFEQLEDRVRNFNQICDSLKLIPESKKRAAGVQFKLTVNRQFSGVQNILNLAAKQLESSLDQVVNRYKSRTWELQQQALALKEKAYLDQEMLEQIKIQNQRTQEVVEQLGTRTKEVQKQTEQIVLCGSAEVQKLHEETQQMQLLSQNQLKQSEQNLQQTQMQAEQLEVQLSQSLKQQIQNMQKLLAGIRHTRKNLAYRMDKTGQVIHQIHGEVNGMYNQVKNL